MLHPSMIRARDAQKYAQVGTVVANVGKELSLLKMAINMANAEYFSFFLWNELEPRCLQQTAGSLELLIHVPLVWVLPGHPPPGLSHLLVHTGPQASHQPSEWSNRFAVIRHCAVTNRHKAVLFPWLNSLVPLEEPQNNNLFLHALCYCTPYRHH